MNKQTEKITKDLKRVRIKRLVVFTILMTLGVFLLDELLGQLGLERSVYTLLITSAFFMAFTLLLRPQEKRYSSKLLSTREEWLFNQIRYLRMKNIFIRESDFDIWLEDPEGRFSAIEIEVMRLNFKNIWP